MTDELLALAMANPFSAYAHPDPISESERETREAIANRKQTRTETPTEPTPPANGATNMSTQTHTNAPHPRTLGEMFPSQWLKPEDLKRPAVVTIVSVDWPEVYNPNTRQKEIKAAIRFSFRKADGTTIELDKRLIVNRTQATAIAEIAKTDLLDGWTGTAVTLSAGRAHTGAATIVIGPAGSGSNGPAKAATPSGNGDHPAGDGERGEV